MRILPKALAAVAALSLGLTACSSSGGAATPTGTATPTGGATAAPGAHAPLNKPEDLAVLDQIKVVETEPAKGPTLTFVTTPIAVTATAVKVLTPGTGPKATTDSLVTVKQSLYVGGTGKLVDNGFTSAKPASTFYTGDQQTISGLLTALVGAQKGSRIVFAIPPAEAFGDKGQTAASIGPKDDLVVVADVTGVTLPQQVATGPAVAPVAGQPTVAFDATKGPAITVPKTAAPKALVSQPLIDGAGPVVKAGQSLIVNYTGALYTDGSVFDSSWTRKAHFGFQSNAGAVIPGWDKGLVGKKVGSRVLLVVPPADGYANQAKQGIPANSTLVFVVDILAAA